MSKYYFIEYKTLTQFKNPLLFAFCLYVYFMATYTFCLDKHFTKY